MGESRFQRSSQRRENLGIVAFLSSIASPPRCKCHLKVAPVHPRRRLQKKLLADWPQADDSGSGKRLMRRMLITASAPHSAETPSPSQCTTVLMHHVKPGHEPIQGPIWPLAMARNRLGLPDLSLEKPS